MRFSRRTISSTSPASSPDDDDPVVLRIVGDGHAVAVVDHPAARGASSRMLIRFSSARSRYFLRLLDLAILAQSAKRQGAAHEEKLPPADETAPRPVISSRALWSRLLRAGFQCPPQDVAASAPRRGETQIHISGAGKVAASGDMTCRRRDQPENHRVCRARVAARGRPRANKRVENQHDGRIQRGADEPFERHRQVAPLVLTLGNERPRPQATTSAAIRPGGRITRRCDGEHTRPEQQDRQVVGLAHRPSDRQSETRSGPGSRPASSRIGRRSASTIARRTTRETKRADAQRAEDSPGHPIHRGLREGRRRGDV